MLATNGKKAEGHGKTNYRELLQQQIFKHENFYCYDFKLFWASKLLLI